MNHSKSAHGGRENGIALLVSLMILLLVSVAGVATMESTGMQLKMSSAGNERQQAFEAAEAGLRLLEQRVVENLDALADDDSMYYECTGANCFKPDCSNGRCFQGVWLTGDSVALCKTIDDSGNSGSGGSGGGSNQVYVPPPSTSPWETGSGSEYLNVWDDADLHGTIALDNYTFPVKTLVEFRCFAPEDPVTELSDTNNVQLFRVTSRGMSNSGRSEVMLQSTLVRYR